MVVTHKLFLDLQEKQSDPVIRVMQDDQYSRDLELTITCRGQEWQPPENAAAQIRCRKPDGTSCNYDQLPDGTTACAIQANVITVKLAPQVLTAPGKVNLSVSITLEQAKLHTFPLVLEVLRNPGISPMSQNYYKVAGSIPDSGWEANKYLGTDADGKVVALDAPVGNGATDEQVAAAVEAYMEENPVETGATAEQAAQIQANADAIADIRDPVVSGTTHWEENTATVTVNYESGSSDVLVAEFDADGNISKLTENGREIPWTTTGV